MARPDIALNCYPIQAAAWRREDDRGNARWSVKISKRQKKREKRGDQWVDVLDGSGRPAYEDTEYLNPDDLLKAAALATEIHRQIGIEDRS